MEILKIYFKGYLYFFWEGGFLSVQNSILFDLGRVSEASQCALLPLNAFPALKLTRRLIALF